MRPVTRVAVLDDSQPMIGPARAFGMDVIAWSQNLTPERATEVGAEAVSKEELLGHSDVLSIHLVLSECTAA
jgi:phosphoglycerate dehydrogenase-like enzyme